jgi:UPF0755 protein
MRKKLLFKSRSKKLRFQFAYRMIGILIASIGLFYLALFTVQVVPQGKEYLDASALRIKIVPKSGISSIANQLQAQGIIAPAWIFQIGARSLGVASKLKPGTYIFKPGSSMGSILLQLGRGDRVREAIKIIPGMTIWQVQEIINQHPALIHETKGWHTKQLLEALGLTGSSLEGWLLPDTYLFDPDDSDLSIYKRSLAAMQKQLKALENEKPLVPPLKSTYELLILASIIEKETGQASERDLISAVFHNRLNKGMRLQTDPTVIYGIGPKFDGNIRKADLLRNTPYNTYIHTGLTPTPIAMPSRESLIAAASPANSKALYFVAKGDGSSHFSESLSEHEKAVDRYQRKKNSP